MTDPVQLLIEAGAIPSTPFVPQSRYNGVPLALLQRRPDDPGVPYVLRRFVPAPQAIAAAGQHVVSAKDRPDLLGAAYLGDPLLYWRVAGVDEDRNQGDDCDSLDVSDRKLVAEPGEAATRERRRQQEDRRRRDGEALAQFARENCQPEDAGDAGDHQAEIRDLRHGVTLVRTAVGAGLRFAESMSGRRPDFPAHRGERLLADGERFARRAGRAGRDLLGPRKPRILAVHREVDLDQLGCGPCCAERESRCRRGVGA